MDKIRCVSMLFLLFFCFTSPVISAEQEESALTGYWHYTVKPGDNLWNLSEKHLRSMRYWKQLVELNSVEDPYNIAPGTRLRFNIAWLKRGATVATVVAMQGKVTIVERHTGHTFDAIKGKILWAGDVIRTGEESNATLRFADGSNILIQAGSEVKLEKLMSHGSTGMAETRIHLKSGRTHNRVIPASGPGSRFEISTPSAIAAVRGTEYRISSDAGGESRAEVIRGGVGVESLDILRVVDGGYGTVSYTDREPMEPVELLPQPEVAALDATVTRVPFPVKLTPVPGAVKYRLQICEDDSCDVLHYDSVFPSANLWGPDLPDGPYRLRIQAVDENGLEGKYNMIPVEIAAHPVPPMPVKPEVEAPIEELRPSFLWTRPGEAVRYSFQLASDESFATVLVEEIRTSTEFTVAMELTPGLYYWRVASIDADGKRGPYSDSQKIRRTPPQPDMSGAELDTERMEFRWRKAEDGQTFRCQIARDTTFTDLIVDEQVEDASYSLQGLDPGEYFIRVAIVDTDGYVGPFAAFQTVRVPSPPPHPLAFIIPALIIGLSML